MYIIEILYGYFMVTDGYEVSGMSGMSGLYIRSRGEFWDFGGEFQ